jgi:hypothetical protein
MKFVLGLLSFAVFSVAAKMPGFDIYLGDLSVNQGLLKISHVKPVTQRPEYDNQPYFLPDGKSLLYTAAVMKDGQEQTDSMLLSLHSGQSNNLTNSAASEYSPTLMPNGQAFSVIWAFDNKQKLWQYPLNSQDKILPAELLGKVEPVGYQAWIDKENVLLFVLGEPHTLQHANIKTQTSKVVASNVGPSLYAIPNTDLMSFSSSMGEGDDISWSLKSYDPKTGEIQTLTALPKTAYYYGWSGDGKALAAVGSSVWQWDSQQKKSIWLKIADLSEPCPKGITRLTTNSQNTKIALVCTL